MGTCDFGLSVEIRIFAFTIKRFFALGQKTCECLLCDQRMTGAASGVNAASCLCTRII